MAPFPTQEELKANRVSHDAYHLIHVNDGLISELRRDLARSMDENRRLSILNTNKIAEIYRLNQDILNKNKTITDLAIMLTAREQLIANMLALIDNTSQNAELIAALREMFTVTDPQTGLKILL